MSQKGKTDLLLRLFDSQFFDEWLALSYIHQKPTGGVHEYLCNRLFELSDEAVQRILSPLCELAIHRDSSSDAIDRALVGLCSRSLRTALMVYWLLRSIAQDRPKSHHVHRLLEQCEAAALAQRSQPLYAPLPSMNSSISDVDDLPSPSSLSTPPRMTAPLATRTPAMPDERASEALTDAPQRSPRGSEIVNAFPHDPPQPGSTQHESIATALSAQLQASLPPSSAKAQAAPPLPQRQPPRSLSLLEDSATPGVSSHVLARAKSAAAGSSGHSGRSTHSALDAPAAPFTASERLNELHAELGDGEGVTSLLQRSKLDLDAGGSGVVSVAGELGQDDVEPDVFNCFAASAGFVDSLCSCSAAIASMPPAQRHKALVHHLEAVNCKLDIPGGGMHNVLWPMGTGSRYVLRVVPERATVLNSAEKAPYLLFVECIEPVHPSGNSGCSTQELRRVFEDTRLATAELLTQKQCDDVMAALKVASPIKAEVALRCSGSFKGSHGTPASQPSPHAADGSALHSPIQLRVANAVILSAAELHPDALAPGSSAGRSEEGEDCEGGACAPSPRGSSGPSGPSSPPRLATRVSSSEALEQMACSMHLSALPPPRTHGVRISMPGLAESPSGSYDGAADADAAGHGRFPPGGTERMGDAAYDHQNASLADQTRGAGDSTASRPMGGQPHASAVPRDGDVEGSLAPAAARSPTTNGTSSGSSVLEPASTLGPASSAPDGDESDSADGVSPASPAASATEAQPTPPAPSPTAHQSQPESHPRLNLDGAPSSSDDVNASYPLELSTSDRAPSPSNDGNAPDCAPTADFSARMDLQNHPAETAPAQFAGDSQDKQEHVSSTPDVVDCRPGAQSPASQVAEVAGSPSGVHDASAVEQPAAQHTEGADDEQNSTAPLQDAAQAASPDAEADALAAGAHGGEQGPSGRAVPAPFAPLLEPIAGELLRRTLSQEGHAEPAARGQLLPRRTLYPEPTSVGEGREGASSPSTLGSEGWVHVEDQRELEVPTSDPVSAQTSLHVGERRGATPEPEALPSGAQHPAAYPGGRRGGELIDRADRERYMQRAHRTAMAARQARMHRVYGASLAEVTEHLRQASPYGSLDGWSLQAVIVKAGDDCRQELLAVQLIRTFKSIFEQEGLPLWLRPFQVLPASNRSALIELLPDCASVHSIKQCSPPGTTLADHFFWMFPRGTQACEDAQLAFAESLAAYSIVCYLLQIKDRHNANIMMDTEGRIIHIDFGFMLSNSPGGVNFERAPFKLTAEYMHIMDSTVDGRPSRCFNYFKVLCIHGFRVAQKHSSRIIQLVEMMQHSGCPCFKSKTRAIEGLKRRFPPQEKCVEVVLNLISESVDAWTTRQYDHYQRVMNGIL